MLPELHQDYHKHMQTILKGGLFDNNMYINKQKQKDSINTFLRVFSYHEEIKVLLNKPTQEIDLNRAMDVISVMALTLGTLFLLGMHKNKKHEEALLFMTLFFLRIILQLTKIHKQRFIEDESINGQYVILADIIENPENVFNRAQYPNLVEQKKILIQDFFEVNGEASFGKDRLAFHVNRKNEKHARDPKPFNGQIIYYKDSIVWKRADPEVIRLILSEPLKKINAGMQGRTQFFIYLEGQGQHMLVLDVQKNNSTMECICIESAKQDSQLAFLKYLQQFFASQQIKSDIIATRAELQQDDHSCAIYGYALGSIVSQHEFAQLKQQSKSDAQGISWFCPSALGKKAILMAQSSTQMIRLWNKIKQPLIALDTWTTLYGLQLGLGEKSYTYIHHREARLRQKESPKPPMEIPSKDATFSLTQALRNYALVAKYR